MNDEKQFKDYNVETIDDILKIDFNTSKDLNLDTAYELISLSKKPKETKELVEQREADNIIKNTANKFLNVEYIKNMDNDYNNLRNMLKKYDVNSNLVKNMIEEDKDKLYGLAEYLFNEFQRKLNFMTFNLELKKDEWSFIYDVLYNKLEYDQNEIFQLKEIKDKYLDLVLDIEKEDIINTNININDMVILYHLISKSKVKGIKKQYYSYLNILTKIGERIKLFNAYNVWVQRLSMDFQTWGGSLSVNDETIKGDTIKPKNIN